MASGRTAFRIFNTDLPSKRGARVAFTYLYGVGDFKSRQICKRQWLSSQFILHAGAQFGINPFTKLEQLEEDMPKIKQHLLRTFKVFVIC